MNCFVFYSHIVNGSRLMGSALVFIADGDTIANVKTTIGLQSVFIHRIKLI